MAEQKKSKKIGRGSRTGRTGSIGQTVLNKQRQAETRQNRMIAAARRRASGDYTCPVDEYDEDGTLVVRAGTVIKRHTKRWREIMNRREEQAFKIGQKAAQRRMFSTLHPLQKADHRACGIDHRTPKDLLFS